jgi:hypothetical protein
MRKTALLIGMLETKGSEYTKEINEKMISGALEVHSALEPGLLEIKVNRLLGPLGLYFDNNGP